VSEGRDVGFRGEYREAKTLNLRLTPRLSCCFTHLANEERRDVEPLPDFSTLSDDNLRAMIHELEKEEDEVSFRRRVLHGRIDILRAEETFTIRDLGSLNGTYVNRRRIESTVLRNDDEVQIGKYRLTFLQR
jgi:hypothetical protein